MTDPAVSYVIDESAEPVDRGELLAACARLLLSIGEKDRVITSPQTERISDEHKPA